MHLLTVHAKLFSSFTGFLDLSVLYNGRCSFQCCCFYRHSYWSRDPQKNLDCLQNLIASFSDSVRPKNSKSVHYLRYQSISLIANIYIPPIIGHQIWSVGAISRSEKVGFKTWFKSSKTDRWADMQRKRIPVLKQQYSKSSRDKRRSRTGSGNKKVAVSRL